MVVVMLEHDIVAADDDDSDSVLKPKLDDTFPWWKAAMQVLSDKHHDDEIDTLSKADADAAAVVVAADAAKEKGHGERNSVPLEKEEACSVVQQ